jgi:hypothetical protein
MMIRTYRKPRLHRLSPPRLLIQAERSGVVCDPVRSASRSDAKVRIP